MAKMGSLRIALVAFAVLAVTSVALGDLTKKVGGTTFYITDSSVPWLTARESCLKKGMTLATIKSRAEADRLRSVLKSRSSNSFWIGATDQGQTGRWYWTSNGAGVGFVQWDHGEPNALGRERCVEIRQVDLSGTTSGAPQRSNTFARGVDFNTNIVAPSNNKIN